VVHLKRFSGGGHGDRLRKRADVVSLDNLDDLDLSNLVGQRPTHSHDPGNSNSRGRTEPEAGVVAAGRGVGSVGGDGVGSGGGDGAVGVEVGVAGEEDALRSEGDTPGPDLEASGPAAASSSSSEHAYQLYAVCNHMGSLSGGHYTAAARCARDGRWYEYDDSRCAQIPEGEVRDFLFFSFLCISHIIQLTPQQQSERRAEKQCRRRGVCLFT